MLLEKLIALAIGVAVIWVMFPHVKRGEFIAPNPIAPNTWMADYIDSDYHRALATPPEGYGMRRIDPWNTPPAKGRSLREEDFDLRWK